VKIVFLCTSLAPGRDGVGDYVRQLAAACAELGHVCLLVALHDRHLSGSPTVVHRHNEVRLSSALPWTRRAAMLGELLRNFDPHWVSWQMVPYGFHPKGILPSGCFRLIDAAKPWQNHVMLHELWLGLAQTDRLRLRLVGALQRRQLLAFLRRLAPACLHTTNPAYQLALARHGWPAEVLSLFGNIPVMPVKPDLARVDLAQLAGGALPPEPRWLGVIFGTIHPQWQPDTTLAFLEAAAARADRPIALVALGRVGAHGTRLLTELQKSKSRIAVFSAGPQPPEKVSCFLQAMDFGIATHPWALIGKSGTAASMLEHGLPVLVPRDDWQSRHGAIVGATDPLLRRLDQFSPDAFPSWLATRREPHALLPGIATRFVSHLTGPFTHGALVA
jgi:hypothetical protein